MRKLSIAFGILLVIAMFAFNCGGESQGNFGEIPEGEDITSCPHYDGQTQPVGYGPFETPDPPTGFDWVISPQNSGEEDGQRVLYFVAEHDSMYRENAVEVARAQVMGQLADAIKAQVIHQVARATETLGVGENEDMEAVTRTLTALRSRAEVSGAQIKDTLVVKMVEWDVEDETCTERIGRTFYRVFVRMWIPYAYYIQLRDGLVDQARQEVPNERQQALINEIDGALADLDEMGW